MFERLLAAPNEKVSSDNRDFSVCSDLLQVMVTVPESKSAGTLIRIRDIHDNPCAIAPVRRGVSAYTLETDVTRRMSWLFLNVTRTVPKREST